MALTLNKLAAATASVAIPVDGDTLNVTYFPNKITTKAIASLEADPTTLDGTLINIIKNWDLYEDDAQTAQFPLDAERLAEIGFPFKVTVAWGIIKDMRPNQTASQTAN